MITVNKQCIQWVENETVQELLQRMNYTFPLIIVKINNTLIPREMYPKTVIPDTAVVDVIHMISGG